MTRRILPFTLLCIAFASHSLADWPRFRGPNGTGIAESAAPTEFGEDKNLKWKLSLPGRGISSPIVAGDRVFVTCYSGYGMGDGGGQIEDLKRHLICVDRESGAEIWKKTIDATMPEDPYRPPGVSTHGYASHTPVCDGKNVYAFFGKSGVHAFDLDGNEIWNQSVGNEPSFKGFGSAASPIVSDNHVIVNASDESLSLVWLDKKTGEEKFRAKAEGLAECWSTPALVDTDGKTEVVLSVIGEVWGLNEATGKLRWYANGVESRNAQVSILVGNDGVVYAAGEEAVAIKAGGKGDVSKSHTVWEGRARTQYSTPVLFNGYLYSVSGTVVECLDAKNGERVFQERIPVSSSGSTNNADADRSGRDSGQSRFGGGFGGGGRRGGRGGGDYASPVVAGDKIYITTNAGQIHVIEAKPEFKHLATNDLSFDRSGFGATPAVSDGNLFIRSHNTLYCFGE